MKITAEHVHYAYEIAKKCINEHYPVVPAAKTISNHTGMAVASACDHIQILCYMLNGAQYFRTLNAYATEYYIKKIREDFGEEAYRAAIIATQKHVEYYNSLGYGKRRQIENLLKELD